MTATPTLRHPSIGLLLNLRSAAVQLRMEADDLNAKPLLDITRAYLLEVGMDGEEIDSHDAQTAKFATEWAALSEIERNARLAATYDDLTQELREKLDRCEARESATDDAPKAVGV